MKDTTKIADTVVKAVDSTNYLDLLERVHGFYDSAWDKLLIIGSLIGIVIPVLYALYQRRIYNVSKKELFEEVKLEISQIRTELNETVKSELQSKVNEIVSSPKNSTV